MPFPSIIAPPLPMYHHPTILLQSIFYSCVVRTKLTHPNPSSRTIRKDDEILLIDNSKIDMESVGREHSGAFGRATGIFRFRPLRAEDVGFGKKPGFGCKATTAVSEEYLASQI